MRTYQDLERLGQDEAKRMEFVLEAISAHKATAEYQIALDAVEYDKRRNVTMKKYQKLLYTVTGQAVPDRFSANHKTTNAFFPRFVTQQNQYLLGNGVRLEEQSNKDKLGKDFDNKLQKAGRAALVQSVAFGFWNLDHMEVFGLTEFAPLYDEENGALRAGVRFWQIDEEKPLRATLYEMDGYTEYIKYNEKPIAEKAPKRSYKQTVRHSESDGTEIFDGGNYPSFPIIPLWGNPHHQSELVGIREAIDCYDLIKNGECNDIDDASLIYWTLQNAGGMDEADLSEFLERMKVVRAASLPDGVTAESHTMDVPTEGREATLNRLKQDMYEDFQIVDVRQLSAGAKTATEIRLAYQPMDNKVDEFEYCVNDFLLELFKIVGIEDEPSFQRSRIVNQTEETQMVLLAANYLDDEAVLKHLPWLTAEEADEILKRRAADELTRTEPETPEETEEVTDDEA